MLTVGDPWDRTSLVVEDTTDEERESLFGWRRIRAAELALDPDAPLAEETGALLGFGEAERFALALATGRGLTRMDFSSPKDLSASICLSLPFFLDLFTVF